MPKDLDDIEDMDLPSSEQANLDVAAAVPEKSANIVDANSSDATDDTSANTLSVVRNVVGDEEAPVETASSAEGDEETGDGAGEEAPKGPDDENYSDVPFHKHPRFQHLLREKKNAEVDAVRYRNVESFLHNSGLEAAEAADGLEIMGLAKTNPAEAWKRIKPWVEKVLVAAGEVVPPDLQQAVQAGEISRERAVELSRARAQVQAVEVRQTFDQQRAQRQQQTDHQHSIVSAASNWEADRRLKDPNFEAKTEAIRKEIAYLHATEGRPKDAQGVTDQCNRAYKAVNTALRAAAPVNPQLVRRPAVRPITGGQVAGTARAEPKSTLDIIRANRRTG